MISSFKFQLDKSSRKFVCPACGQKRMVKYMITGTQVFLADNAGKCDREHNCGYHYTPKQFFLDNPQINVNAYSISSSNCAQVTNSTHSTQQYAPVQYLPLDILNTSIARHKGCNLYPFLVTLFGVNMADQLAKKYFIGANKQGYTVFWQVDIYGRVRQAKIMQYSPETGRRNKEKGALFAGKTILGDKNAQLQQCFFGEHLLSLPENSCKPVAISESEKTAVVSSVYYPEFVWLATGGKNGARWTEENVCSVLRGRQIILFPDIGAYDLWKEKGLLLENVANCRVATSDLLERIATVDERNAGLDIADYLLKNRDSSGLAMTDYDYPVIWDYK